MAVMQTAFFIRPLQASLHKLTPLPALSVKYTLKKNAEPRENAEPFFAHPESLAKNERLPLLTDVDLAENAYLSRLRNRDSMVRTHEQSHLAAVDGYARGGPHYNYIMGPDGRLYAVSGSIDVDMSPVPGNPEATIRKARIIRRASLSPLEPSGQDIRLAAQAYRMEMEAQKELGRRKQEETGSQSRNNEPQPVDMYA